MLSKRKLIVLSVVTLATLLLTAYSKPIRGVLAVGQPGGYLSLESGTFTDSRTGKEFGLTLLAGEGENMAGAGNFTVQVLGEGFSICSTHGGGVDIGPQAEDGNYYGNFPLTEIQCGTSFGMAVSIDECTAKTELHGYSHSDYPFTIYSGPNTVELTFRKTSSTTGLINIKAYTPKGPIKLSGNVSSSSITLDTCQL